MYHSSQRKTVILMIMLLGLALLLSGCIFTPEEINDPGPGINGTIPTINVVTPKPTPVNEGPITVITQQPTQQQITFITPVISSTATPTILPGYTATPVPTPVTVTASPAPTSSTLKLGSKGDAVKEVQKKLRSLGFLKGSADGDFGTATEQAVKDFQKQYKLTIDGKVGPKTLAAIQNATATKKPTATPTPKVTPTPKKTPTPTVKRTATPKPSSYANLYLRLGDNSSQVKQMQERLISLGYLSGKATGKFDGVTEKAVIAFQKRNCSYSDGVAGPDTLTALYSSSAKSTSSSAGTIGISYKYGDESNQVAAIQKRLTTLGYYSGNCNGKFGSATEDAVRAFQKKNGLTVDGIVGDSTLVKLNSSSAISAKQTATPKPTAKATATPRHTATPPANPYVKVTKSPTTKYITLREGNWGEPVQELQQALKNQGYFSGTVDGIYGEQTVNAVKSFQKAKGLIQDGIAGFATQQVLYEGSYPDGA